MPTPTSHGSTLAFDGTPLGRITGWRESPAQAVYAEKTNVTSPVVGFGSAARILKSYDCVAIDPGQVEVTLWGCPPWGYSDTGRRGAVSLAFDGGSLNLPGYLDSFEVVGAVGQFLVGRAVFRLTGEPT
jgi:hypothetical protein